MATLYSRLYTEFNTNWATGVIAKPSFVDGRFQRYSLGDSTNACWIIFDTMNVTNAAQVSIELTVAGNTTINKSWPFGIELVAHSDANLELLLEQTLVRLLAYSGTNLRWVPVSIGAFSSKYGERACYVNCIETSVVAPSAW